MGREKSMSPEKVKRTSVTVKKVSTIEKKGIFSNIKDNLFLFSYKRRYSIIRNVRLFAKLF